MTPRIDEMLKEHLVITFAMYKNNAIILIIFTLMLILLG